MVERSVKVRLMAEIGQYMSNMRQAGKAAQETAQQTEKASEQATRGMGKLSKLANEQRESWSAVSTGLMAVGTIGVAGLGAVTKAAMGWESAWTGVQKTVSGTPQQMKAVEDGLRGLSKVLPASHDEIAAVAEAAGQLGIATPDIVNFTRTMIDLGESTNLSADEAATSLARFMNIMGTASQDVSRLGSTIVGLGNNFATTEAEIMAMSMRLAGTGNQIGLTEGEVMGLAAAMSSVGIEAEAGGTAMSMTMSKINTAVKSGSAELDGFASMAGVSAEEFAKAWAEDPAAALDMFVQGVGRAGEAGQDVNTMLDELGIKGVREIDTLLRLGGAAGLLGEAFAQGNTEFEKNSALAEEAAKRYATTESQMKIAWNGIKDSAIDAGAVMLPIVQGIADQALALAEAYGMLPGPVQGAITGIAGIAAVSALAVGSGMKMITMASDASTALTNLGVSSDKAKGLIGGMSKGIGVAVAAFAALQLASWAANHGKPAALTIQDIGIAIRNTESGALDLDRAFEHMAETTENSAIKVSDLDDAMNIVHGDSIRAQMMRFGDSLPGVENDVTDAKKAFEGIDATLSQMASSGSLDKAAEGFEQVARLAREQGYDLGQVAKESFPAYRAALQQLGDSYDYPLEGADLLNAMLGQLPPSMVEAMGGADAAAGAMAGLAAEMGGAGASGAGVTVGLEEMAAAAHEAETTLSDLFDQLFALGLIELDAQAATGQFHQTVRDAAGAVEGLTGAIRTANGEFEVTTEAGNAAHGAFYAIATDGIAMSESIAKAGGSVREIGDSLGLTYDQLVANAEAMGFTSEQANNLAREALSIPEDVSIQSWMSDQALRVAAFTGSAVHDVPPNVDILSWMSDAAFLEAVRTKAAALGIPEHEAISSFMESVARNEADKTTAAVLGIPEGADVQSWMSENAENQAWRTKQAIDAIPKQVTITTHLRNIETFEDTALGQHMNTRQGARSVLRPGFSTGGRIPSLADGGRLPSTGLGTDKILGVSSMTGAPTAWVDDREWVVNRRSSDKYDGLINMVNRDDPRVRHLAGFAAGGRPGSREYTAAPAGFGAGGATVDVPPIDYDQLAAAMSRVNIRAEAVVTQRTAKRITALGAINR